MEFYEKNIFLKYFSKKSNESNRFSQQFIFQYSSSHKNIVSRLLLTQINNYQTIIY